MPCKQTTTVAQVQRDSCGEASEPSWLCFLKLALYSAMQKHEGTKQLKIPYAVYNHHGNYIQYNHYLLNRTQSTQISFLFLHTFSILLHPTLPIIFGRDI